MHQLHKVTPAWNSTCFGQFLCPSSGVYSLYTRQDQDGTGTQFQFHPGPARKLSTNLYDIYQWLVLSEYSPDDVQRNCRNM